MRWYVEVPDRDGFDDFNHPLEELAYGGLHGVKRFNPELDRYEFFRWTSQQWEPGGGAMSMEVSYADTWAEPVSA